MEKVGVGGVVLIRLCLCVLACERQGERDGGRKIAKALCVMWEMFCNVGVFLRMSSTCIEAMGRRVKCTPTGRELGRCDVGPLCRMCVEMWVDIGWFWYFEILV